MFTVFRFVVTVIGAIGLQCHDRSNCLVNALDEQERITGFYEREYTWPPKSYVPNTKGWKELFERRLRQAAEVLDREERYGAYLASMQSAVVAPNFTEYGFGLTRAPEHLMEDLRRAIHDGLAKNQVQSEPTRSQNIEGDSPWFIERPDLVDRVLRELQYIAEEWVDMDLAPGGAYGFRLYRNGNNLNMHIDVPQTHVISFILHIASSDNAEPWPLLIEGFDGNTHEIVLTSGDMLLYESSKCLHGRPQRFKGEWYTSIYVHYYPKVGWAEVDHFAEAAYAVPPTWDDDLEDPSGEVQLEMLPSGMKEPSCPNGWCASQTAIPFAHGPGIEGVWVGPTGEKIPLMRTPKLNEEL